MGSGTDFIMRLSRNSEIIDYGMHLTSSFMYSDRGILCSFRKNENYTIYMYLGQSLMAEGSSVCIKPISKVKREQFRFRDASKRLGKISILTNIRDEPDSIYMIYKHMEEIGQSFDSTNNKMENDKTNLRSDESVR